MQPRTREFLSRRLGRPIIDEEQKITLTATNLAKLIEAAMREEAERQVKAHAAKSGMTENMAGIIAEAEKISPGAARAMERLLGIKL